MERRQRNRIVGGSIGALAAIGTAIYLTRTATGKRQVENIRYQVAAIWDRISSRLLRAKKLTRSAYEKMVDLVVDSYAEEESMAKKDANALKREFKKRWEEVRDQGI